MIELYNSHKLGALPADIVSFGDLLINFSEEVTQEVMPVDIPHARRNLELLVQNNSALYVWAEDTETCEPVGLIFGILHENILMPVNSCTELVFVVDPDYRNGSIGPRLLKHFEDVCKQAGVDEIHMGAGCMEYATAVCNLYTRRGYIMTTVGYRKDL